MGSGFLGFGGSDSTSSQSNQASGDAGINVRTQGQVKVSSPGSALTDLSGSKITSGISGITAQKGATVTISSGLSSQDLSSALKGALGGLGPPANAPATLVPSDTGQPGANASGSAGGLDLGGLLQSYGLYIVGGLAVLFLLFFILKRKR